MRSAYSELTANDIVVLSHITRACDFYTDAHVSQTTRGIALSLRISERHTRRILARLEEHRLVARSEDKVQITGAYCTRRRAPRHVYRITTAGLELIGRYKADLRW